MTEPLQTAARAAGPDPITVGLIANRLHSLLNEQQTTLINTAFSTGVRESVDIACAVFDSRGEMIGQSSWGAPGHINAMATGMRHIVRAYPAERLVPGDVLVTNDPWLTAGQVNDITIATPVFRAGRVVAWFSSCCHSPDIGGRILSASASEVFEEGLQIPIMKFLEAGRPNEVLFAILRQNVRTPDATLGDMYAQVAGNEIGGRSLVRLMDEFGLESVDGVAAEIMDRSERALRAALRAVPDGVYRAEMPTDGFGGEECVLRVAVTVAGDEMTLDYAGSSGESAYGINVCLNYTRAYSSFAVKAALAPDVPHNAGSFRPIHVVAPEGSILNCTRPAPVAERHIVGHFLPSLVYRALQPALPDVLPAASADALWTGMWRGRERPGPHAPSFTLMTFHCGGMGARPDKDGLSAVCFPTGVRATSTEILEGLGPVYYARRELRGGSGGAGRQRGGLGQTIEIGCHSGLPWSMGANVDRCKNPAPGAVGGMPGAPGQLFDAETADDLPRKEVTTLDPGQRVVMAMPGGGGFGDGFGRVPELVLADVVDGYVDAHAAEADYGVAVRYTGDPEALVRLPEDYELDRERTAELRAARG